jgi:uncharacterized repeat protein (TIGR03806 family)
MRALAVFALSCLATIAKSTVGTYWLNSQTGKTYIHQIDRHALAWSQPHSSVSDTDWHVAGSADFNNDGHLDILWRHQTSGVNWLYLMRGNELVGSHRVNQVPVGDWDIAGVGDVNGDGSADIIWRNNVTGLHWLYLMNGHQIQSSRQLALVSDLDWDIAGVGDVDGDETDDIVWRHGQSGAVWLYRMSAGQIAQSSRINVVGDLAWRIAAVKDANGDGLADILWRHASSGMLWLYLLNGQSIVESSAIQTVPPEWQMANLADTNNDGRFDIVWRHAVSGDMYVYMLDGRHIIDQGALALSIPVEWQLAGNLTSHCGVFDPPPPPANSVAFEAYFGGQWFDPEARGKLIFMQQAPGEPKNWYLGFKGGYISRVPNVNEQAIPVDILNISDLVIDADERGLLGFTFDPSYPARPYVYVSYVEFVSEHDPSIPWDDESRSVLSRFTMNNGVLDPSSEQRILTLTQPFFNHNGGHVAFGPDGYLYISFGDGGEWGNNEAQNPGSWYGTVLRIDVVNVPNGQTYGVPADNPFATDSQFAPEVFAYGFRNPWRFSIDQVTGDVWLGDVGESTREEVNLVIKGGNYGWPLKEGSLCFFDHPQVDQNNCPGDFEHLIDPVVENQTGINNEGVSVIGGYVYRGSQYPNLVGRYIYGDWLNNTLWSIDYDAQSGEASRVVLGTGPGQVSFAESLDGELFALNDVAFLIVTNETSAPSNVPTRLSQTGCFRASNPAVANTVLRPYSVNSPLWSDGAEKHRWLMVPEHEQADLVADGDLVFPAGSVLAKDFWLNNQLVETRLLVHHQNGGWTGYSYAWRDDGSDADLRLFGERKTFGIQEWQYPSSTQCLMCHTEASYRSLSAELLQLKSGPNNMPANDSWQQMMDHQIINVGLHEQTLAMDGMPSPSDVNASIEQRAKAYLHANCSFCHRPENAMRVNIDVRFTTPLSQMGVCGEAPVAGDLGVSQALIVSPGDAANSILSLRMKARGANQMPPVGTLMVDDDGTQLIDGWIGSLGGCP